MTKEDEENLALNIYCKLNNISKDIFERVSKTECPDIQTKNNDIGIEVTRVCNAKDGELDYFFKLIHRKTEEQIFSLLKRNKKLKNYVEKGNIILNDISNGVFYGIGDNIEPLLDSIKIKLDKLQEYKLFDTNVLFLIIKFQILDKITIERFIIKEISELEKSFEYKYDEYIIFDYLKNVIFVINDKKQVTETQL